MLRRPKKELEAEEEQRAEREREVEKTAPCDRAREDDGEESAFDPKEEEDQEGE